MDYPFTAIPKWFFPLVPELSEAELRIMMVVFDNTTGWQVEAGIFAYTFLSQHTGMTGTSAISKALKSLEKRGIIQREPKKINGQRIQIFPKSPILPIEGLLLEESRLLLEESVTPLKRVSDSSKKSHIKNPPKNLLKEPTTMEKFTPDQEKSLAILVGGGLSEDISRQLIVTAWKNGRDSEYIEQIVGYVFSVAAKNPPGMIRSLITQNSGRIPTSQGPGPMRPGTTGNLYHYYDNGGLEFEKHTGRFEDCQICQEVRNEAQI